MVTTDLTRVAPETRLITVSQGRPAYPVRAKEAFGISPGDWRALVDAIWPAAQTTEAVELALSYCRARNLDPFKRPIHIVPVWDSKKQANIETVWPGIGELRTTASRTGLWAGNDEAVFGPDDTRTFKGTTGKGQYAKEVEKTVTFPLWAQVTQYKMVQGHRVPFPGPRVLWLETYATMGASDVPNEMWATRPYGQIEKCAEAASLRRAFPEEVGGDMIPEEIGKRTAIDITPSASAPEPLGSRTEALAERLRSERNLAPDVVDAKEQPTLPETNDPRQELDPSVAAEVAGLMSDIALRTGDAQEVEGLLFDITAGKGGKGGIRNAADFSTADQVLWAKKRLRSHPTYGDEAIKKGAEG